MGDFQTYKWPLNVSNFTWTDRLKLAKFFLSKKNRWTMGDKVKEFEKKMAEYVGSRYAVFTSSGSTANTLLAMYLKDKYGAGIIVFPSTTWTTSVAPFVREGFTPHFIDINLKNLSMDLDELEKYLKTSRQFITCIFITSLVGLTPNIDRIKDLSLKYNVEIMMDNCENTLGTYQGQNISHYFTSTTSTYFGHQLQSIEGGFVFTNKTEICEKLLMYRNHGMVRSLSDNFYNKYFYINKEVDPNFDFFCRGNNFRNSEIHALVGLLDFKRIDYYTTIRRERATQFYNQLDPRKYWRPIEAPHYKNVPFCLPIIRILNSKDDHIKLAMAYCKKSNIEYRPIISGNLLRQTCFKQYGKASEFPISELLHRYGFYVGLHPKIDPYEITNLVNYLNKL